MSNYENNYQSGENYKQDNYNPKKMSNDELKEVSGGGVYSALRDTCKKAAHWLLDLIKK